MNDEPAQQTDIETSSSASEIAHALESTPGAERNEIWESLTPQQQGEALPFVNKPITSSLLSDNGIEQVSEIAKHMSPKNIVELVEAIPKELANELIDSLDGLEKEQVECNLHYPEETVGRLIGYSVIAMRADRDVSHVLEFIRNTQLPSFTDKIFIIGKRKKLLGAISLETLLEAPLDKKIGDLEFLDDLIVLSPTSSSTTPPPCFGKTSLRHCLWPMTIKRY